MIAEYYDKIFPFSEKKKVFLQTQLSGSSGEFLDIGCATGDLVFYAESLGLTAAGIDNDFDLLKQAEEKKIRRDSSAEFVHADMMEAAELFDGERFDVITCMGNTIAHLNAASDFNGFFSSVHGLLKEGGVFTGQSVNYGKGGGESPVTFNKIENNEFEFIRRNKIKGNGKVEFRGEFILKSDRSRYINTIELYPVTKDLIDEALGRAGFNAITFFGGFDLRGFENSSNALIFRAEK